MKTAVLMIVAACATGLVLMLVGNGTAQRETADASGEYRAADPAAAPPTARPAARPAVRSYGTETRRPAARTVERTAARTQRGEPIIQNCLIALRSDGERNVPAEEAGVLTKLMVKEGDEVKAFQRRDPRLRPRFFDAKDVERPEDMVVPLAEVDKSLPVLQRLVAEKEYDKADKDAKNMVSILYAERSRDVADMGYRSGMAANDRSRGVVPELEIAKLRLEWEASKLKVQQSRHEQNQAILTTNVKEAELANAEQAIEHRDIHSPIDGVIAQIYAHEGEWVRPGDPVFRIINLRQLRVQATLNAADYPQPGYFVGKAATISVKLSQGEGTTFPGRIVHAQQEIKTGGRYTVWAEIDNPKTADGYYILSPGLLATMTIHSEAPTTAGK